MHSIVLRDVSEDELQVWPKEVTKFFNQFAGQKAELSLSWTHIFAFLFKKVRFDWKLT